MMREALKPALEQIYKLNSDIEGRVYDIRNKMMDDLDDIEDSIKSQISSLAKAVPTELDK